MSTHIPITSPEHDRPEPAAHTPGPWEIEGPFSGKLCMWIITADYSKTLVADNLFFANARLVAAAPDLLALAAAVAAHFQDTDAPLGVQARAAIAKATGQVPA